MNSPQPLRARQRAQLVNEVRGAALRLFAERGFDAVTVDDIAAAAGISKSTFFRIVASKDILLIDPLLEGISAIVAALDARPSTENVNEALIAATVAAMTAAQSAEIDLWRAAIRTAPQLISRVTLVSQDDQATLIELVAHRMGTNHNPAADPRPGLLVTITLAASEYVFRNWITNDRPEDMSLPRQVENALRMVLLTPDWTESRDQHPTTT
ncbi:TetR/AcrR family transcriptional regulator [Nocardia sp. NBC_00565]|uniref:TetR family transcriptional regulator n=1 Tax=Nocardia sp. NBC_00565 TaxID=2975993 RepID=UPI002E815CFF|nr:TetR family transcriptional regulator [Nocardia sp. NBC_00565]WUC02285.1 TetR/AcrR family transcriptional regulator [Nocardia sp. NBC_00565]